MYALEDIVRMNEKAAPKAEPKVLDDAIPAEDQVSYETVETAVA